jgi:hypothetical protein
MLHEGGHECHSLSLGLSASSEGSLSFSPILPLLVFLPSKAAEGDTDRKPRKPCHWQTLRRVRSLVISAFNDYQENEVTWGLGLHEEKQQSFQHVQDRLTAITSA